MLPSHVPLQQQVAAVCQISYAVSLQVLTWKSPFLYVLALPPVILAVRCSEYSPMLVFSIFGWYDAYIFFSNSFFQVAIFMNQVPEACLIDGCTLVSKYPGFMTVRTLLSQSLPLVLGFLRIFPKSK